MGGSGVAAHALILSIPYTPCGLMQALATLCVFRLPILCTHSLHFCAPLCFVGTSLGVVGVLGGVGSMVVGLGSSLTSAAIVQVRVWGLGTGQYMWRQ